MRVVERKLLAAIRNCERFTCGNTRYDGISKVYLYGNLIADIGVDCIRYTFAGWKTRTTASRLNALLFDLFGGCRALETGGACVSCSVKDPHDPHKWYTYDVNNRTEWRKQFPERVMKTKPYKARGRLVKEITGQQAVELWETGFRDFEVYIGVWVPSLLSSDYIYHNKEDFYYGNTYRIPVE